MSIVLTPSPVSVFIALGIDPVVTCIIRIFTFNYQSFTARDLKLKVCLFIDRDDIEVASPAIGCRINDDRLSRYPFLAASQSDSREDYELSRI